MIGKVKMKQILSRETGMSIRDITASGIYERFGTKERLTVGSYRLTYFDGEFRLTEPDYGTFEDDYVRSKTRILKEEQNEV